MASLNTIAAQAMSAFKPPPKMTISEWADAHRQLSSEASAMPGRWRTRVVEFMREPMDCIGNPCVKRVILKAAAQVAKTEVLLNTAGYLIHHDPSPIMVVQPTLDMAKAFSKDRIAPMVRDTRVLAKLVREGKSRDSDNTIFQKTFPGGHLTMVGANSPSSLASRPIRAVLCDEVDRFPLSAGTEGDPIGLAVKRTVTFWNRVIVFVSTPTVKGASRIDAAYMEGDQRKRYCGCPHCGLPQVLKWAQIQWEDGKPETAMYYCEHCGAGWSDAQRINAVRKGYWQASAPFKGIASFHITGMMSPFVTMADAAREFLEAKSDPTRLMVWVNTYLGETWEETGDRVDAHELMDRREEYITDVPEDVCLLTAGIDVQDNRLEMEVVGWGDDGNSWSIAHHILYGDPSSNDVWEELTALRKQIYQHPLFGDMSIQRACIDSGGHFTQQVYRYVRGDQPAIFAIKGIGGVGKPIVGKPSLANVGKIPLVPVGTHTAKELVMRRLAAKEDEAGYCHFPMHYEHEFFAQMTAEELTTKYRKGRKFQEFTQIRRRNEVFDCRVYATAALELTGVNLNAHRRQMEITLEKKMRDQEAETETTGKSSKSVKRKRSFVDSWRDD